MQNDIRADIGAIEGNILAAAISNDPVIVNLRARHQTVSRARTENKEMRETYVAWKANDIEVRGSANERFYALRYPTGCQVVLNKAIADFVGKAESLVEGNNH